MCIFREIWNFLSVKCDVLWICASNSVQLVVSVQFRMKCNFAWQFPVIFCVKFAVSQIFLFFCICAANSAHFEHLRVKYAVLHTIIQVIVHLRVKFNALPGKRLCRSYSMSCVFHVPSGIRYSRRWLCTAASGSRTWPVQWQEAKKSSPATWTLLNPCRIRTTTTDRTWFRWKKCRSESRGSCEACFPEKWGPGSRWRNGNTCIWKKIDIYWFFDFLKFSKIFSVSIIFEKFRNLKDF